MDKALITSLLRVYHATKQRQGASGVLSTFVDDYNIGQRMGSSLIFTSNDKERIRKLLLATESIDAETTRPDQWDGLSRAQSLAHGSNEKLTREAVRSGRVAVKALLNKPLLLDQRAIFLPSGANLDLDWHWVSSHCDHTSVLLVENWEAFDCIHNVNFDVSKAGTNPLVVFRGSPVYRQDYVVSLLRGLEIPVFAFVDYDPAGLMIAQSLPHFAGLIVPPLDDLGAALHITNNHARYRSQLAQTHVTLSNASHPDIVEIWCMLQVYGKALPQEYFVLSGLE